MARQRPGEEEISQRLDRSINGLDAQRTENLKRIQLLQTNKYNALERERTRLQKKYSDNNPRVAKISKRLDYDQAMFPEMKSEIERSRINIPEFDANTWMVHGLVLNSEQRGVKGLTLALYDTKGMVEKRFGYACTDERGYYAIRYQVGKEEKTPFYENINYILIVTDSKGKILHKEKQALNVVIGQMDYRLIILRDSVCTPPPGWDVEGENNRPELTGKIGCESDQKPRKKKD